MDLPDWIDTEHGIGAGIVAALGMVGIVVRSRSSKAASDRRALAKEATAGLDHDAKVAPIFAEMLKASEERCKREAELQSERHEQQRLRDRQECDERVAAIESHSELLTDILAETRRRIRVLERHPRVVDVSDDDEPDTAVTRRLEASVGRLRRTPTPPGERPAVTEQVRQRDDDERREPE